MKKSQVLAALALAFALGLGAVAPTASTYATVIYPVGTTQEQIDANNRAINSEVNAALKAYGDLEKVAQYDTLYFQIEDTTSGLRKTISDDVKALLTAYNNDTIANFNKANINSLISQLEALENGATGGLYEKNADGTYKNIKSTSKLEQATLKSLSNLSRANNLTDAYNAARTLRDTAAQNLSILNTNYNTPAAGVVETAINLSNGIFAGANAFLNELQGKFAAITSTPDDYANLIKAVSESAYDSLVNSAAWVNATDAVSGRATRYGLAMQAAANLPKYKFVKPLQDAKKEFDKIRATDQDVDYAKAKEYIAAFNTAIANYRDGKATGSDGSNNNNDGDGEGNKAPDTGVLANAEGSASTTVAMVAGIATALTAAGAGVVAYRNARRSTRK